MPDEDLAEEALTSLLLKALGALSGIVRMIWQDLLLIR